MLTVCNVCGLSGFVPVVGYAYDAVAKTITVTDDSTFAAGDGLAIVHITITDGNGDHVKSKITVTDTPRVVDVSGLDEFLGFNINVMVVTNNRSQGVLSAYNVGRIMPAAGNLRYVNKSMG